MPTITSDPSVQTVITTFEVTPGTCDELIEVLREACNSYVSKQPGFIGAAIHVNDARTRIANYTQWESREAFKEMMRKDEMRPWLRQFSELCKTFEPVMYDVVSTSD
ncbi:MAG: antibiotic biosynthesis monooxygenase [Maritimibacter sp.]|jgi:heme-degrading monooxygenase HmoA